MPPQQSASSSRRGGPLEESRAANRSISASFTGTKPSLSSASSSRKSTSSMPSSSKGRSASSKHRNRFDDDDDDIEEEEEEEEEDHDIYDEEENDRRHSNKSKASAKSRPAVVDAPSRKASESVSRQVSGSMNINKSILARSNPNASLLMGGAGGVGNASMAFQASRVAALARSHAASDASAIMRPRGQAQPGMPGTSLDPSSVSAVAAAAAASASLRVDNSSFEEWMKMATDNKINSTNTWSFALIDYFHDMSLLRNDSGDGSINFQKASCTLDGCVKVWTSRVDSVVVETGKLLSGLQDDLNQASDNNKRGKNSGEDGADDEEDDDDEDGDQAGSNRQKKKKSREATLAKNFSQIQIKKFDLEFTVDPLFKKTSADFDEGGAGGLLMNHLGVDSNMRVIFDASDVAGVGDDEDDMNGQKVDEETDRDALHSVAHELVDLTKLREKLFNSQDFHDPDNAPSDANQLLAGRVLCPTLCNFRFSKDDDTPFGVGMDDFNDQTFHAMNLNNRYSSDYRAQSEDLGGFHDENNPMLDGADPGDVDFFANMGGADMPGYDEDEDGGGDFFDALDTAPALNHGGRVVIDGTTGHVEGGYGPFDPSAGPSSELVMAMAFNSETGQAMDEGDADNPGGLFDYFDRRLMRNWAGPEHWKLSRVTGPLGVGALGGAEGAAAKAEAALARKENKKSKEPFVIDFLSDEAAVSSKEIFEPAKQAALISLPASARPKLSNATSASISNKDAYLLPEDRHFSSKQLLRLFLKPRVAINMRRKGSAVVGNKLMDDWASSPNDDVDALQGAIGGDDDDNGMPFDTQFFHDADDGGDGGGDDGPANSNAANGDLEDEDLMQTMQALNRVKPEYVNYAKKATRVDIKKLKENIWKELGIPQSTNTPDLSAASSAAGDDDDDDSDMPTTPTKATVPAEKVKTFNSVINGLKKAYTQDRMEEISTSFCFICLLHLANEEGLALSTGSEARMEQMRSKRQRSTAAPALGSGRIISSSQDDDDLGGEPDDGVEEGYEEDDLRVGTLELLQIAKDPKAYRSA